MLKKTVMTMALGALLFGGFAAAEELPFPEIISANAECRAYFWAGYDAISEGDVKGARDNFERAAAEDNGCFMAYYVLSQIEDAQGDDEKATRYLEMIPPEPPELDALYEDIVTALRADDYETVASQTERLVAAYPQTIRAIAALHLLGRAEYHLGRLSEAKTSLGTAYVYSALAPGTVPAYGSQAEAEELEKFAGMP
jgi:tetratricopeptide (TPR) repeat protein